MALSGGWSVVRERGTAADLHAASADSLHDKTLGRLVRFVEPSNPAVVLGSHQPLSQFDGASLERSGLEVARRRSGGSAVLVGDGQVLWVDFAIGRDDVLWDDDVRRAAWWVGELWAGCLADAGLGPAEVWRGGLARTRWSEAVCFAGVGPGEVTLSGRKVVGVCQRRSPRAALFQTAALLDWRPGEYAALLAGAEAADPELVGAAAGLGPGARVTLESALSARLMP